jgi:ribonuclease-3
MSRRFTALARKEALARVAESLSLGDYLDLAYSENEAGGRKNPAILADACEAMIAALYLDGGLPSAQQFIHQAWEELIKEAPTPPLDSKTSLQEWTQANSLGLPVYEVLDRSGPPHDPIFVIGLKIKGYPALQATGPSKRKAEQAVAKIMLNHINSSTENRD